MNVAARNSISTNGTVRIPKALMTSDNCAAIRTSNTYTFANGLTINKGETMVLDLDRCPRRGEIVVMGDFDKNPFARLCEIPPLEAEPRGKWIIGTPDADPDVIVFLKLGNYDWFGVMTGVVPKV